MQKWQEAVLNIWYQKFFFFAAEVCVVAKVLYKFDHAVIVFIVLYGLLF